MKDELVYLNRILELINKIEEYIDGDDFDKYEQNEMKVDATIMKLQALGETIKKIGIYDNIPYKEIIGLRDWISHDYFGLDIEIIWNTLKIDIPELKEKIIKIIQTKPGTN